jgi:hypothetical protein
VRTTATSVAGLCLALVFGVSACTTGSGAGEPTTIPSLSPGSSPSPTASALTTPDPATVPEEFRHRDPGMTDAEALSRLDDPATREFWLTQPREIPPPLWAEGDPLWDNDLSTWWELGRRGTSTIAGVGYPVLEEFFEIDADGHWTWVLFPSPREAALVTGTVGEGAEGVTPNTYLYYDSLALPLTVTLVSGEPLLTPLDGWGFPELPEDATRATATPVRSLGDYRVARYERSVSWVWSQVYDVKPPSSVNYRDVFYVLETPYGMIIPLTYSPFGILEDVEWSVTTKFGRDAHLADLNDIACGIWDTDHNTVVDGLVNSDWKSAGVKPRGDTVYVPTSTNPLVGPMHEVFLQANPGSTLSLDDFAAAPALVGYHSRDIGAWVVYLNGNYSGRAWC